MEEFDTLAKRRKKVNRIRLLILALLGIVIIAIAVAVPVAILHSHKTPIIGITSNVLVPLYIYPAPGAWDPLFSAINAHPNLGFTVILNPDSGPGALPYPNGDFFPQIQRLNQYSNVDVVGYVHTSYGTRNITNVLADVATYSAWAANSSSIELSGIFFDEAPSEYSSDMATYMSTIDQAVKNAVGLQQRTVIHNPGIIPDARLNDSNTDITVVFEGEYSNFQLQRTTLASLPLDRSRYSYIVHSVPSSVSVPDLSTVIAPSSQHADFLYFTYLDQNPYESFGPHWNDIINAMPM